MWTNLERELDGMVGRMLSWLAHPPARPSTLSSTLEDVLGDVASRSVAVAKPARAVAREVIVKAGKGKKVEAAVEATAPAVEATTAEDLETEPQPESEAGKSSDEPVGLQRRLLIALAAAPKGASMKQLQQATGSGAYAARQLLNRLIRQGRVERKGKGMRTHYHLKGPRENG